jgi:fluoroquinolone transport system permease protein
MNALQLLRRAGPVDLKNLRRDPLLTWVPVMPLILAAAYRYGLPALEKWLQSAHGFELAPVLPLAMSLFLMFVPMLAGMLTGFQLLDERDEGTLEALRVTPVSLETYMRYRLIVPVVLGMVLTIIAYPAIGILPLSLVDLLALSFLAALTAPLVMLFLAAFAENKVTGFAMVKLLNGLLMIPLAAYFLPGLWPFATGIIPTFWPLKAFWLAADGASYGVVLIIGVVINTLAIWAIMRRFRAVLA